MLQTSELQILFYAAGVILAANFLSMMLFVLYAKLPDSKTKELIRSIIFELDRFADSMENTEKRRSAIQQINEVLGWRKFIIPGALIGWVIDTEVAVIRQMQRATNTPNLHEEE
jgi:hypothetical protein